MEAPLIQRMTRMNAELAYRFCVREKLAAEQVSRSRPLFITHEHMREADAADRYEVVERLEHTALSLDDPSFRLDYYAL